MATAKGENRAQKRLRLSYIEKRNMLRGLSRPSYASEKKGHIDLILSVLAPITLSVGIAAAYLFNKFNVPSSETRVTPASTIATACIAIDGLEGPFTFRQAIQRGVVGSNHMPEPGEIGYIHSMEITYPKEVQTGDMNSWVKMSENMKRTGEVDGYFRVKNADGTYSYFCK